MGADDEWRVPVPTWRIFITTGLRLNAKTFARPLVEADDNAVLERRVDCIRIFRIDLRTKSVATLRYEPIGIYNTGCAARS